MALGRILRVVEQFKRLRQALADAQPFGKAEPRPAQRDFVR
jgi:hypothetical protein